MTNEEARELRRLARLELRACPDLYQIDPLVPVWEWHPRRKAPRKGCRCPNCVARRAYQRSIMRTKYQENPAYKEKKLARQRLRYRNLVNPNPRKWTRKQPEEST